MSIADINSLIDSAVAAQADGDAATALNKLRAAQMLLAGTPDTQHPNGVSLRWDRNAIAAAITQLERAQAAAAASASGGMRRTKLIYKRVSGGCE